MRSKFSFLDGSAKIVVIFENVYIVCIVENHDQRRKLSKNQQQHNHLSGQEYKFQDKI